MHIENISKEIKFFSCFLSKNNVIQKTASIENYHPDIMRVIIFCTQILLSTTHPFKNTMEHATPSPRTLPRTQTTPDWQGPLQDYLHCLRSTHTYSDHFITTIPVIMTHHSKPSLSPKQPPRPLIIDYKTTPVPPTLFKVHSNLYGHSTPIPASPGHHSSLKTHPGPALFQINIELIPAIQDH